MVVNGWNFLCVGLSQSHAAAGRIQWDCVRCDMAIFSKKICEQKLNTWLAAEEAIATGQSYQMGTHMLTRANLTAVRNEIEYWAGKLAEAEAAEQRGGRNRIFQFVPRDT